MKSFWLEKVFTEEDDPFTIKPKFSKMRSLLEFSRQEPVISFLQDRSIRDVSGFDLVVLYGKYNLSPNPLDVLSFHNVFLETDITQGMIFRGEQHGVVHSFFMDVDPGLKIEKTSDAVFNGIWLRVKTFLEYQF